MKSEIMIILYEENGFTKLLVNVDVKVEEVKENKQAFGIVVVKKFSKEGKVKIYPPQITDFSRPIFLVPPQPPKLVSVAIKPKTGPRIVPSNISYISSKGIKCGIATYSQFLSNAVSKHFPAYVHRRLRDADPESLIHVQVEFGVFQQVNELLDERFSQNYKVATWHTVFKYPHKYHLQYYHAIDREYDTHIVHNILAKKFLTRYVRKPVYIIPHGCVTFNPVPKLEARKKLGLPLDIEIGFCFGFAADSKGFREVLQVADQVGKTHKKFIAVISAAEHGVLREHSKKVLDSLMYYGGHGLVLGRYLSEEEINLYASASDMFLFNYRTPSVISSASGALKRVVAAGKPVVCSEDTRMIDLVDGHHCLKYPRNNIEEFKHCVELILDDSELAEKLGSNIRNYALKLSWENTALKHLKLYEQVTGKHFGGKS